MLKASWVSGLSFTGVDCFLLGKDISHKKEMRLVTDKIYWWMKKKLTWLCGYSCFQTIIQAFCQEVGF